MGLQETLGRLDELAAILRTVTPYYQDAQVAVLRGLAGELNNDIHGEAGTPTEGICSAVVRWTVRIYVYEEGVDFTYFHAIQTNDPIHSRYI
jgi:hypothetical protein